MKVRFNLTKIMSLIRSKIKGSTEIELLLDSDSMLLIRNGSVSYYFTQESLQKVLDENSFDSYFKDETEELISDLTSKHIINELFKAMGTKVFPEVN